MGAAAAIEELQKPVDCSDIIQANDLNFAVSEIIRLRKDLGHLAEKYNIKILSYDASDIVLGNYEEDFNRCVKEISHIRQCLRLNTLSSSRNRRGTPGGRYDRGYNREYKKIDHDVNNDSESDSDSDSDSKSDSSKGSN